MFEHFPLIQRVCFRMLLIGTHLTQQLLKRLLEAGPIEHIPVNMRWRTTHARNYGSTEARTDN